MPAVILFGMVASGCSVYKPKAPIPQGGYGNEMLKDVSAPNLLETYNAMLETTDAQKATKVARRNRILQELIWLVDQNYGKFEDRYYGSEASINVAGDIVNLGLTGVSSVTGTAHLKSVLSAIATGTTGIKTSYQKNFFDQQTRSAVVQKMRSLRATQLAILQDEDHMKADLSEYSLESGLSDVDAYFNAGTIIGALQSIAEGAGTEQKAAKDKQLDNSRIKQPTK